jgi:hypothetical protein
MNHRKTLSEDSQSPNRDGTPRFMMIMMNIGMFTNGKWIEYGRRRGLFLIPIPIAAKNV